MSQRLRAFTLIELLVVIAIIGVLSSVVLSSLNTARAKSNDAKRLSDLHQVAVALELFRDAYGYYPPYVGSDTRENSCFSGGGASDAVGQWGSALSVLVSNKYLSALPNDPKNNGVIGGGSPPDYCYAYHIAPVGNTSLYDSCKDAAGTIIQPGEYEYMLYFSVEIPSSTKYSLNWNGAAVPPHTGCLLGPHR